MASQRSIPVRAGADRYEVLVSRGLLDRIGPLVAARAPGRKAAVIADETVASLYLGRAEASLREAGIDPISLVLPAGEQHKNLDTLRLVYDGLFTAGIERGTPLLGLGGGVITDLAGFAAATLLRGLPYVPVPTSLLAMVDASIGGKTAINHAAGKNLIGAFHQPAAVLIDPDVLVTLPPIELSHGLAEVIKHCIIRDARAFAKLEAAITHVLRPDVALLSELVAENVAIKAAVVEADPHERGLRVHLNFGHTFGHAIERASGYAIPHGQAVALGICAAMTTGVELGMATSKDRERVIRLILAAGLPAQTDRLDVEPVLSAMQADKKVQEGRVRFVLPERIGSVVVRDDVPREVVHRAVESVCG